MRSNGRLACSPRRHPQPRPGARHLLDRPAAVLHGEHRRGVPSCPMSRRLRSRADRRHPHRRGFGHLHWRCSSRFSPASSTETGSTCSSSPSCAAMVGIFSCRAIRQRAAGSVRAAGLGGLTVACFALLIGFADSCPYLLCSGKWAPACSRACSQAWPSRPAAGARGPVQAGPPTSPCWSSRTTTMPLLHRLQMEAPAPTTTASSSPTSRRTPPTPSARTPSSAALCALP